MAPLTLTERMKQATAARHAAAERSTFIRSLLDSTLPLPSYRHLMVNLRVIYQAMEEAMHSRRTELGGAKVDFDRLARLAAIDHDLDSLAAAAPDARNDILPATTAYVDRLSELSTAAPVLLMAHAYVRYLGDLNGGQVLRKLVGRIGAPGAFYDFGEPSIARALASSLKQALNDLTLDDATASAMVAEAVGAFERHERLFDELDRAGRGTQAHEEGR